jgi:hypothetical protein
MVYYRSHATAHEVDGVWRGLEWVLGAALDLDVGFSEGRFLPDILLDVGLDLGLAPIIIGRGFIGGLSLLPAAVKLLTSKRTSVSPATLAAVRLLALWASLSQCSSGSDSTIGFPKIAFQSLARINSLRCGDFKYLSKSWFAFWGV